MSDTPFTDSCTYGFTDEDGIHCEAVHADVARTLERERDEARKELRELNDRFVRKCVREAMLETRLAEKYGLRTELEHELGTTDDMTNDESLKQGLSAIRKLKQERDEARAALQRITECDMRWSKKVAREALEASK